MGLALMTLAGSAAHAAAADAAFFPTPVYVTLQGSDAVQEFPSGRVCKDLPAAHYIDVSPDGKRLIVSSAKSPEAWLVDTSTCEKLATFSFGTAVQGVAFDPTGHRALVVAAGDGTAGIIDVAAARQVARVAVGPNPHNAVFAPDGRHAYVTLQGGAGVAVVDMDAGKKLRTFAVPGTHPHNLAFSPNRKTLWLRGFLGRVMALDAGSDKLRCEVSVGASHAGIDVLPDGCAVTGDMGGHDVVVVGAPGCKLAARVAVGAAPHGVRVSRDGRWIYAGVTGDATLAVIDARSLKVVKRIPVAGKVPFWLAVAQRLH